MHQLFLCQFKGEEYLSISNLEDVMAIVERYRPEKCNQDMKIQLTMIVLLTTLTLTSCGQDNDHKSVHRSADSVFIKSLKERKIFRLPILSLSSK
ncbi:hypothetical protein [Sphingobacterium athyrii]|uniref:Uncharacterized protein n=1 Tax=Sphingobacterium athyrii TaxID=2152717 RepID=A0A363NTJ6_9SPHI|nr:hypothetical protein [Sphingobacterium athyrii]PUV24136.1 hypothetical protein DCO56_12255 [Sphingobacterium athyrii]